MSVPTAYLFSWKSSVYKLVASLGGKINPFPFGGLLEQMTAPLGLYQPLTKTNLMSHAGRQPSAFCRRLLRNCLLDLIDLGSLDQTLCSV